MFPAAVLGHAKLVSSTPAAKAVLAILPAEIVVTFNEPLVEGSSLELVDAAGLTMATGRIDPSDPQSMRMGTPDLANGSYEIRWAARTDDGNIERGKIPFVVAIATPVPSTPAPSIAGTDAPSPAPSPTPSTEPTPTPTASDAPAGDAGGAGDAVIPIVAAVALVGAGLVWFLRRRPAA